MTYCTTCKKDVEKACKTKKAKSACLFNKLRPDAEIKPVKGDPDYKSKDE